MGMKWEQERSQKQSIHADGRFVRFRVFHEMQRQKLGERDLDVYQISIGHCQIRISMINMCQWA